MTGPLFRLTRVVRTVRHLRSRQIVALLGRGRGHRVANVSADPGRMDRSALAALADLGPVSGSQATERRATAWMNDSVLGVGCDVRWEGDWNASGPNPLWRYHLLYHDHLADLAWLARGGRDPAAASRLEADLERWDRQVPLGSRPAWDAYPVSVRLTNWARILAWGRSSLTESRAAALVNGIATHTTFLRRAFEWHLDGNHLLRNAWAVAIGDIVLGDRASSRRSIARFAEILADQVSADGWHVERTPMYQARILRDALELQSICEATATPLDARSIERIQSLRRALPWMLRSDGSLWALNDTATDHEVALAPLLTERAAGVRWFREAGAAVAIDDQSGDRIRFDLSGPAPAHQPGHAHAGALGYEVDVAGLPLVVDGGCSGYDGDPWRAHLRGTSAHSTITVDGRDQSEMWATFRVGGRASVSDATVHGEASNLTLRGSCRPWFDTRVVHHREIRRVGRTIRCEDRVSGAERRHVEGFLHFDPAWDLTREGDRHFSLRSGSASLTVRVDGSSAVTAHRGDQRPLLGWRAAGFGQVVPAWSLRMRTDATSDRPLTTTIEPR